MNYPLQSGEAVPRTLYHYTSLDALVSIVNTKRLRASNIRFLNDRAESVAMMADVIDLLQSFGGSLAEQADGRRIAAMLEKKTPKADYVASLSEKDDLLSQWRAYCPSGRGVSIGFNTTCLRQQWIYNPKGNPLFLYAELQKVRYYDGNSNDKDHVASDLKRLYRLDYQNILRGGMEWPNPVALA